MAQGQETAGAVEEEFVGADLGACFLRSRLFNSALSTTALSSQFTIHLLYALLLLLHLIQRLSCQPAQLTDHFLELVAGVEGVGCGKEGERG